MATPDFVLALREQIGHAPLWLSGVTAVVARESSGSVATFGSSTAAGSEVLLVKRADSGAWTPVTGIIDPGEEPAIAAVREVLEEADIIARAEALVWVHVIPTITYANGDESQYLDLVFRCGWVSGDPFPADGENTEAAWYPIDALPPMSEAMLGRVRAALAGNVATRFEH